MHWEHNQQKLFFIGVDRILRFKARVCIPVDKELKKIVREEGLKSCHNIHPSMIKIYKDLKGSF